MRNEISKEAEQALKKHQAMMAANKTDYSRKNELAFELEAISGHPLQTLTKENKALEVIIERISTEISDEKDITELCDLSVHYAKKGDLLYPLLKVKYDISGPSDVMWTTDDEIRDELSALLKDTERDGKWQKRFGDVLKRAKEMIFKEQNILFPICAVNFTEEEWKGIYCDAKDYGMCFGVEPEIWELGENIHTQNTVQTENEIIMPGGHLTISQLTALLNTIPMEITFVDAENINRYFNEGEKVFKRPGMAIDREVFSCHPPKIEPMVRSIIADFRSGKRDSVPIWMEKGGRVMLVKYMAVRDKKGNYLGTVELVQDMEFAREYFSKKG